MEVIHLEEGLLDALLFLSVICLAVTVKIYLRLKIQISRQYAKLQIRKYMSWYVGKASNNCFHVCLFRYIKACIYRHTHVLTCFKVMGKNK